MQSLVVASVVEKYDDFRKIAYSIEYLLNLLDCETLKHMEFIFSFQNTLQLIQTCKPLAKEISKPSFGSTERLIEAIDGCYNSLGIREYECLSSLWKNASVVTLRRESLIKLEQEFDVIGKRLGLVDKKITDIVSSALMDVEAKIKHSMLEAVSTLYYLDASPVAETESMTEILSKLPTEIAMHLNKLDFQNKSKTRFFEIENPLQEPLSHLESLGTRGMRFGLTPITDIKSLRAQKLIILKLSELLLADSSIVEKKHALMSLASDISACIEYEIEETLNSAQNLLPFQRMVWILNAKWSDTLLGLLEYLAPAIILLTFFLFRRRFS
ncbi:hypothetical protein BC830DRAFT_959632 [Chytriomyces sp. MP71]|nr:hypothetical protein BC830DRAFT_959632 [Chytriomyces sp. MP71]